MSPPDPLPTRRLRLALSLGTVAALAGLLVLGELVVRHLRPDESRRDHEYWSRLALQVAPCTAPPRREGALRVVVVGESSGEFLGEELLHVASDPSAGLDVVNCGRAAASLEQVAVLYADALALAPDAVVVVFGHNLAMRDPADRALIDRQRLLSKSALVHAAAGALVRGAGQAPSPSREGRLPTFEAFLRRVADDGRRLGFKAVFLTVTPNEWQPPAFYPFTHHVEAGEPAFEARFLRASGARRQATALLAEALAKSSDAGLEYELATWLAADGELAAAHEAFDRAVEHSINRATAATNALVRRVAIETGSLLRDTLADRERAASDGISGWESVRDNCHLRRSLFRREAWAVVELLLGRERAQPLARGASSPGADEPAAADDALPSHFEALRRAQQAPPGADQGSESPAFVLASLASAVQRLLHEGGDPALADLERVLARDAATNAPLQPGLAACMLVAVAEGEWNADRHEAARLRLAKARSLAPTARGALLEGLWALGDGRRDEARAAFARALAVDPLCAEARADLARLR